MGINKSAAMAKPSSVSLFFLLHLALAISTCGGSKSWHSKQQAAFFIFGDSYLDSGNNNYINTTTLDQANFWPYGETYFKFPTGRFSDGRLMSDFIGEICKSFIMWSLVVQVHFWLADSNREFCFVCI